MVKFLDPTRKNKLLYVNKPALASDGSNVTTKKMEKLNAKVENGEIWVDMFITNLRHISYVSYSYYSIDDNGSPIGDSLYTILQFNS